VDILSVSYCMCECRQEGECEGAEIEGEVLSSFYMHKSQLSSPMSQSTRTSGAIFKKNFILPLGVLLNRTKIF